MKRDGTGLVQLTSGGDNSEPALSSDGRTVFYTSRRDGPPSILKIPIEGGESVQVIGSNSSWADVSPDGRYIAYLKDSGPDAIKRRLGVMRLEDGQETAVFTLPKNAAAYNRLRWTADGKSILYKDGVQGLWRQDLDKEKPERIPAFDDLRVFHFSVLPNGGILYSGGVQMRQIMIVSLGEG